MRTWMLPLDSRLLFVLTKKTPSIMIVMISSKTAQDGDSGMEGAGLELGDEELDKEEAVAGNEIVPEKLNGACAGFDVHLFGLNDHEPWVVNVYSLSDL